MRSEPAIGAAYAVAAFAFWGLTPIYYKWLHDVPPLEVLCHRVLWSVVFGAVFLSLRGGWRSVATTARNRRLVAVLFATAVLVSLNWLVYIYAVVTDRVMATSLGYYINPLVNVLLGMLFLGERLSRGRVVAVGLATAGTTSLALHLGGLPWISLTLAFSFGFYGLLRKRLALPGLPALFIETALLAPVAVAGLAWFAARGQFAFTLDLSHAGLLVLAGPVTLLPLVWFAEAAERLELNAVGFVQYLAPTITFLLAVAVYDEPLTTAWLVTFLFIWAALAVFTIDGLRARRRLRRRIAAGGEGR